MMNGSVKKHTHNPHFQRHLGDSLRSRKLVYSQDYWDDISELYQELEMYEDEQHQFEEDLWVDAISVVNYSIQIDRSRFDLIYRTPIQIDPLFILVGSD